MPGYYHSVPLARNPASRQGCIENSPVFQHGGEETKKLRMTWGQALKVPDKLLHDVIFLLMLKIILNRYLF